MKTLNLVKENMFDINNSNSCLTKEQVKHNIKAQKLNKVLTHRIPVFTTPHSRLATYHKEDLEKRGFHWIVDSSFVTKFKFHAILTTSYQNTVFRKYRKAFKRSETKEQFFYIGDIPDGALDRIEQIKNVGYTRAITIHSNEPLPVVRQEIIPQVDPVVLAWSEDPIIQTGIIGKNLISYNKDITAVVVAVWDYEKEFPL